MKLAELLKAIENNTIIKIDSRELDSPLDNNALEEIANKLANNKSVIEIHIEGNLISAEGVFALCDPLKYHEQILTLSLSGIQNAAAWIPHVVETLKANKTIEVLKLNNNQITDEILDPLNKMLGIIFSLKEIYLENNQLTDVSVAELVRTYKYGHQLTLLSLKNNQVTDKGAKIFADYLGMVGLKNQVPLQFDPCMTHLSLDGNPITDLSIGFFEKALENNRFMTTLTFSENLLTEKSKNSLEIITKKLVENLKFSQQFLSLGHHFKKIGEKPGGNESPGGVYLKLDDKTEWLIKLNIGPKAYGERIGTIQEYVATKLMRLWIPDYPMSMLLIDGGLFKVSSKFISELMMDCQKFNITKPIKHLFLSYLMCYVLADPDAKGNRWFYEDQDDIFFYKGDLGMAFYFTQSDIINRIDIDTIANQEIAKFFGLDVNLVDRAVPSKNKIAELENFKKVSNEQIIAASSELRLLGQYGEDQLKTILKRVENCRAAIPGLIKQIQNPKKFASFIQIPPSPESQQKSKEKEPQQLTQEKSSDSNYQSFP